MVLFPYVISILLLWPDSSCHALSFTGLRPSGMYTLAYTQPSLWLVYCIISQIQRLTQALRFLGPLAYTRTPNYSTPMLLFSSHYHYNAIRATYQRIDLQALFAARPDCAFWFTFRSWVYGHALITLTIGFASAAMALSSRQSSHNILITGSHM